MSKYYVMGFAVGLGLTVVVAVLIGIFIKSLCKEDKYDEMQNLWRLKGYRAGFWTLVGYLTAYSVFDMITGIKWADTVTASFIGICLAITVYAVICIAKNAYFPYNRSRKRSFALFAAAILLNVIAIAINAADGTKLVTNGMLNIHSVNAIVLVPFVFIFAALGIKIIASRGRDGE